MITKQELLDAIEENLMDIIREDLEENDDYDHENRPVEVEHSDDCMQFHFVQRGVEKHFHICIMEVDEHGEEVNEEAG